MVTISHHAQKTTQSLIAGFLILSMLAGVLSACTMVVETPKAAEVAGVELTPSQDLSETKELTLVPPSEMATEIPTITLTPEPTPTATIEPTATATQIPTETAPEFPPEVHLLSAEELAEKKLYGSGFELKTNFRGIPVDLTMVTSKAILEMYKQTQGCVPNQEMVKYGASAEDRMAEMVFLGHYVGYLRYIGLKDENAEANYPFDNYIGDLKAGADRSYTVWGPRLDGSDGEFRVNPLAPLEYVFTAKKVDPDGNGRGTSLGGGGTSRGYLQLENGGMRMVEADPNERHDYTVFCQDLGNGFDNLLRVLGIDITVMQGRWQLGIGNRYPTAYELIRKATYDIAIWEKSNHLIWPSLLLP